MRYFIVNHYKRYFYSLLLILFCSNQTVFAEETNTYSSGAVTIVNTPQAGSTTDSTETMTYADESLGDNTLPVDDPLEGLNRAMFAFNDTIDDLFWRPLAKFYNLITPKPLNQGIDNFFTNIRNIPTIVNDILQLRLCSTLHDTWRFGINTTLGIGGLFDVASYMQLDPYTNDFGLTLQRFGYQQSSYLVLPFFGSFTVRDSIGFFVDYFEFSIYPYINPPSFRYEVYALGALDRRAHEVQFQPLYEEAAFDKYIFVRNAYFQHRAYEISANQERSCTRNRADALPPIATIKIYD